MNIGRFLKNILRTWTSKKMYGLLEFMLVAPTGAIIAPKSGDMILTDF